MKNPPSRRVFGGGLVGFGDVGVQRLDNLVSDVLGVSLCKVINLVLSKLLQKLGNIANEGVDSQAMVPVVVRHEVADTDAGAFVPTLGPFSFRFAGFTPAGISV